MRLKAESILEFGAADEQQNGIVREYRDEYKTLSELLDKQPKVLEMVHRDLDLLSKSTSRRGRKAVFTSENLFRAILVMQREGLDYREASVRIAESETLQRFCRLLKKSTIDFTLLSKAFGVIQPETWENDQPPACTEGSVGRDDLGRTCANRHDRHRVQHSLADRFKPALGHLSRCCPERCHMDESSTRSVVPGDFM